MTISGICFKTTGITGGEGDDRGWDGWMASLTQWTWVWVNSRSWWWTGRPGMLWFMGLQRVRHSWATEMNWTELNRNKAVLPPLRETGKKYLWFRSTELADWDYHFHIERREICLQKSVFIKQRQGQTFLLIKIHTNFP